MFVDEIRGAHGVAGRYRGAYPGAALPSWSLRSWQRIKWRLERDILNGMYKPGSKFPLVKVLERRYSANRRTLARPLI